MKNYFYLIILATLFSCKSPFFKITDLQGSWSLSKEDNVSFTISKDSIYYPEYSGKFNLKMKNNNLEIFEQGHLINKFNVVKVSTDSLFLKLQDGKLIKYCKIVE